MTRVIRDIRRFVSSALGRMQPQPDVSGITPAERVPQTRFGAEAYLEETRSVGRLGAKLPWGARGTRMAIELCVLASGSGGNATVLRAPSGVMLIDAGLGPRTTATRLTNTG